MCSEATSRKHNHAHTQEEWDQAKEKWNEFSQKFSARFNEHFSKSHVHGERADKHVVEVKLPNGREFSFKLGHLIFAGLALWLLPFNLVVLAGLLWLAYMFGNNADPRKSHDGEEKPKRKVKADEIEGDFEVYKV